MNLVKISKSQANIFALEEAGATVHGTGGTDGGGEAGQQQHIGVSGPPVHSSTSPPRENTTPEQDGPPEDGPPLEDATPVYIILNNRLALISKR